MGNAMSKKASVSRLPAAQTTSDLIANVLRAEIAGGGISPGKPLRQEEIASRFGVSRIPVREALRLLEAEGLLVIHANRGAFVRSFTPEEVEEVYDLRLMLEPDLIRRSVAKMTPEDVGAIERLMLEAEASVITPSWRDLDNRFHIALYAPAQRTHQSEVVLRLRSTITHYSLADNKLTAAKSRWLADHRAIFAACRKGDASEAAALLKEHLQAAANMTLQIMKAEGP